MRQCDVVVLGAGPGGYVAAIRAAQLGAKVTVVERDALGGVCLNWGCIPTKTLIHTAELYRKLQHADEYGLKVKGATVDMKALIARKNDVVKKNTSGIRALFKGHGIDVVKANAEVVAPGRVRAGGEQIHARSIIVATGSSPGEIPGLDVDGERVITSTEALDMTKVPKRVLVIGAGALGAEFACIWNALGAEVHLVEMMPNVLPLEDEELTKRLASIFKKRGINVHTKTMVKELDTSKKGVHVQLAGPKAGSLEVDLVLVGIGRWFNSEAVADSRLGVKLSDNGQILVNDRMATSVPGVYAIGDVTGKTMLAHGASAEGLVAAANALGDDKKMDYRVVPTCNFTTPEVASVGMTEKEAVEAGIDVKVGRFSFMASGRAHTLGETEGMVKIVGDAATDEVVGVHVMGAEAGELIASGALAMSMEATVDEVAHTIHTHPTLSETIMEAAENYLGLGIHTPPKKK
jgi:dihydrolipoamide dehydrogenase